MTLQLPEAIARFFTAENANDTSELAACFLPDGLVRDEAETHVGPAAIGQWMTEAKRKYQHTVAPLRAVERDGRTVVTARVTGNFPGSPADLDHSFQLAGDRIAELEIG